MILIITLAAFLTWLVSSRILFRYFVSHDSCTIRDSYGGTSEMGHGGIAAIAMLCAALLPVTLSVMYVIHKPPMGKLERERYIKQLEAENKKLQRNQENV